MGHWETHYFFFFFRKIMRMWMLDATKILSNNSAYITWTCCSCSTHLDHFERRYIDETKKLQNTFEHVRLRQPLTKYSELLLVAQSCRPQRQVAQKKCISKLAHWVRWFTYQQWWFSNVRSNQRIRKRNVQREEEREREREGSEREHSSYHSLSQCCQSCRIES